MESADAFNGRNAAVKQYVDHFLPRMGTHKRLPTSAITAPQMGAAGGTGRRLGMKTPVSGVSVFLIAGRAQRKNCHRGERAIVWHTLNNGKPWPAVGAVNKRIAKAAVGRIAHLAQTFWAGCGIGHNLGIHLTLTAFNNAELMRQLTAEPFLFADRVNARQRRALLT